MPGKTRCFLVIATESKHTILIVCRPPKFNNLFEGLDNSKMYEFEELKKNTFQDIFRCANKQAVSLKKPINYINYTNEE